MFATLQVRINPYSNGIWIELVPKQDSERMQSVLILILMEYG